VLDFFESLQLIEKNLDIYFYLHLHSSSLSKPVIVKRNWEIFNGEDWLWMQSSATTFYPWMSMLMYVNTCFHFFIYHFLYIGSLVLNMSCVCFQLLTIKLYSCIFLLMQCYFPWQSPNPVVEKKSLKAQEGT